MQEEEPPKNGSEHQQDADTTTEARQDEEPATDVTMEDARHIVVEEPNGNTPSRPTEPAEPAEPIRPVESMELQELDDDDDDDIPPPPFSWLEAHPSIVVILTGSEGEEQQAFAIHKDFLCSKSSYFRKYFLRSPDDLENVIKFPDVTPDTFGFVQHFIYTGEVYPAIEHLPGYEALINIWKVGYDLGIDGLCDKALEGMQECRQITQHIPATPLLVQVWNETPEGSAIRTLLLGWAAEYMRSSEERAEFAKSLPREVLSELVVAISSFGASHPIFGSSEPPPSARHSSAVASPVAHHLPPPQPDQPHTKNVHYLSSHAEEGGPVPTRTPLPKKPKRPSLGISTIGNKKAAVKKPTSRQSLSKPQKRRSSATSFAPGQEFSTERKLEFCADLLTRMLSGPGFWTRLVGPFKFPVAPVEDGVPDYLEKVTKPMDLGTIKAKMDKKEYKSEVEFVTDVRQIFHNCFTYWTEDDAMWATCVKFQKTFEEKYAEMNKWLAKMSGQEGEEEQ